MEALMNFVARLMMKGMIVGGRKLGEGIGTLIRMGLDKRNDTIREREYAEQQKKNDT